MFKVFLRGPLRAENAQGEVVTPNPPRVRALLALLAEPPLRRRSRRWLVAHLWSDKPFKKSSMSLRQALAELRNTFGPAKVAVCADRTDIWLDPELVEIDNHGTLTPLEGLDVDDEGFEDWLRDFRACNTQIPADLPPPAVTMPCTVNILTRIGETSSTTGRITARVIVDQVGQNLEDMLGSSRTMSAVGRSDIEITTHVSETSQTALLNAQVVHGPTDAMLFSGHRSLEKSAGVSISPEDIAAFAYSAARRAMAKLPQVASLDREEIIALGHAETAKRRLFSYLPGDVEAAGSLFARAYNADPAGMFLAWQAFQRTAMVIESLTSPSAELLEEADSFLRRALELSPESAHTHALVALVRLLLFDDFSSALVAAEAGLRRNPSCLLSHQAMAMTAGAFGDKNAAYQATSFCRPATLEDDARHLWDLYHGLVCISTDRYDEAFATLKQASRRCPSFKAPHRQLIALSLHLGDEVGAREHLATLQQTEPEFDLNVYKNDGAYPVATLRSAGLLHQSFDVIG